MDQSQPVHEDLGDLRARVVKLQTDACASYAGAFLAAGATETTGSYTIASDVLAPAPRPTVDLSVYADANDNVLAAEVVQAVYRDSGVTLTDPATGQPYGQFTFYVLVCLQVPNDSGQRVSCFAWSADPECADALPPYDTGAGRQGFSFNSGWTAVSV